MERINRKEAVIENVKAIMQLTGLNLYIHKSGVGYFMYVIDNVGRYQYTPFGLRYADEGYTLKELCEVTNVIKGVLCDIKKGNIAITNE